MKGSFFRASGFVLRASELWTAGRKLKAKCPGAADHEAKAARLGLVIGKNNPSVPVLRSKIRNRSSSIGNDYLRLPITHPFYP
jgi:hypothetical protein